MSVRLSLALQLARSSALSTRVVEGGSAANLTKKQKISRQALNGSDFNRVESTAAHGSQYQIRIKCKR
jgi:hypothetical protein